MVGRDPPYIGFSETPSPRLCSAGVLAGTDFRVLPLQQICAFPRNQTETACVAAPHTLPQRQRPSEKAKSAFQTASISASNKSAFSRQPKPRAWLAPHTLPQWQRPSEKTKSAFQTASISASNKSAFSRQPKPRAWLAPHTLPQWQRPSESTASAQPKPLFRHSRAGGTLGGD